MSNCKFYVIKKKRNCRMIVSEGEEYCAEHLPRDLNSNGNNKRISCPLDNKHSCYEKNLKKHLKICNAREKPNEINYIIKDINSNFIDESIPNLKLNDVSTTYLNKLIAKLTDIYQDIVKDQIVYKELHHEILKNEILSKSIGHKNKKHLIQNSSLLGHLLFNGLLQPDTCFIEFGAGKGKLSYWLSKATENLDNVCVVLIDRSSLRHKQENKISVKKNSLIRIKANIADICLEKIPFITQYKNVVVVTKHLCGSATDMTLNCIGNAIESKINVRGILLSFCCHHQCTWSDYVGKQFFMDNELFEKDFQLMTSIASWAVCGIGRSRDDLKNEIIVEELNNRKQHDLTKADKEKIGFYAKAIIDYGRWKFVQSLDFKKAYLSYYVSSEITPENLNLLATNYDE